MLKPIPQGSKVGIISPSCALDSPENIRDGLRWLEKSGYRVVLGKYVYEQQNHLAGTAQQRAEDIMRFFKDPEIKAIFSAAGGYGAQEILPLLDYNIIRNNPKPIIGFSDSTALQMGIYAKTGNVSYAGILLKYDFGKENIHPYTADSLIEVLNARQTELKGGVPLNRGRDKGLLIGTNLCVLEMLAGTPYYPNISDSILFLEDVDEKSYRVERMLTQLSQHPEFNLVRGIVFGKFTSMTLNHPDDKDINQIIDEFAARYPHLPMIKDFPFGHVRARKTIPLGVPVELDADNCSLKIKD